MSQHRGPTTFDAAASPPTPNPNSHATSSPNSTSPAGKQVSRVILRTALQKAKLAVECDTANDVDGAVAFYTEAVSLLDRVISTVEKPSDRKRLQEIHDSYSERIRLISTIKSDVSQVCDGYDAMQPFNSSDVVATEDDDQENEAKSWLAKPAKRKFSTRFNAQQQQEQSVQSPSSLLRRMTSSSSLESSVSSPDAIENIPWSPPQSARSSRWQNVARSSRVADNSPPSPVSSKSTPTQSRPNTTSQTSKRKSTEPATSSSPTTTNTTTINATTPTALPPRGSSRAAAAYVRPSAGTEMDIKRSSSISSDASSTSASVDSSFETSSSRPDVHQPAMTLPPLSLKRLDSDGSARLSHQYSNHSLCSARMQNSPSASSSDADFATAAIAMTRRGSQADENASSTPPPPPPMRRAATQVPLTKSSSSRQSNGFVSVRKKSSQRSSRVSLDGSSSLKRGGGGGGGGSQSGSPLFGLFMKNGSPGTADSMDYFGAKSDIGVAYTTKDHVVQLVDHSDKPLRLILSLEKSMDHGAYITPRLYIPKNMWQQPNIRLPHLEIKVAACETLMNDLARLEKWSQLDDLTGSLKLLEQFLEAVESLQNNLSKKLKRESMDASTSGSVVNGSDIASGVEASSGKRTQSFMSWGSKLSKSVERMNAFGLTRTEDHYRNYIEVLQRAFAKLHLLSDWWDHYTNSEHTSPVRDVLLQKLTKICEVVDLVIGGFVVRDMAIILAKWLKRGGSWVNE
ncbi:hypothetical protein VTP01DRAFT_7051 [Rhizomucor pusillus]|uniref:uncharacterized protein n=1 Tax=Rhizomucor pusillus TaxID=4840 RepID=UPI003742D877